MEESGCGLFFIVMASFKMTLLVMIWILSQTDFKEEFGFVVAEHSYVKGNGEKSGLLCDVKFNRRKPEASPKLQ